MQAFEVVREVLASLSAAAMLLFSSALHNDKVKSVLFLFFEVKSDVTSCK